MRRAMGLAACAASIAAGLVMISGSAIAAIQVPEQNPGLISLWTDDYPLDFDDLDPGESIYLRLDVALDDTDSGDLELELRKSGDLATMSGGLEIVVERCAVEWAGVPMGVTSDPPPTCASGRQTLLRADRSDDYVSSSPRWQLGEITDSDTVHLLATLSLPGATDPGSVLDRSASFAFGLFAEGRSVVTAADTGQLALSGVDALSLVLIAAGAIGAGLIVSAGRRREVHA